MSDDITSDDIHQLAQQGDLRAYMRSLIQRPESKSDTDVVPRTAPPKARPDGQPVGAWPARAGRPGDPIPYIDSKD